MKKIKTFFRKKSCTITIGINGAFFAFHHGRTIEKTVFIKDIKDAKKSVKTIFQSQENYPIYILLDDNDQTYKQKTYPAIKSFDVSRLIKKDLFRESPKTKNEVIKNVILNRRKSDKKWNALLFWAELKKNITEWIDFLILIPKNRLVGIYLLPVESKSSLVNITEIAKKDFNISRESNIDIITFDTAISGLRQFIFHNNFLILNREPDHHLESDNFTKYFEQDMLRIIQYLKRSFPEIKVSNINFINILSKDLIKKLDSLKTKSLKISNYESNVISKKLNIKTLDNNKLETRSDEILANNFINSKKKFFKFSTFRIKKINILYFLISSLFFINISIILFLGYMAIKMFIHDSTRDSEIIDLNLKRSTLEVKLNKIKKQSLGDPNDQNKFYEIIDFGQINEFFANREDLYLKGLTKASVIPKDKNSIKSVSYSLKNFKPNNITSKYKVNITGSVINKKGGIDQLFSNFDNLISSLKTSDKDKLKYDDIPNNINFNKKFYKYPFDITIESQ